MLFLKDHPHCLSQHENDRVFLAGEDSRLGDRLGPELQVTIFVAFVFV